MPAFIYSVKPRPPIDTDVRELLDEVNKLTKRKYYTPEVVYRFKKNWFSREETIVRYEIYRAMESDKEWGCNEYQLFNLSREGYDALDIPSHPKAIILAYFYGVLNGISK